MQKKKKLTDGFQLSNGVSLPCVGYGTWQTPDGEIASKSVKLAIEAGYRHIDCAAVYANEISVGHGIKSSGISRSELFITSKVWNTERGYDKTIRKNDGYDITIHWRMTAEQFLGRKKEESA